MQQVVIEYVLDGGRPGYRFRPPTGGLDRRTLDAIWRQAMPRGQGWGESIYAGARSLKVFPVGRRMMAISDVIVTDQADEMGRRGIRRAEVGLMPAAAYMGWLEAQLAALPEIARAAAGQRLAGYVWQRILDRALLRGGRQVVLAHPYTGPEAWQMVEALVLRLVTSPGIRLLEGWGPLTPFTTLALDARDESRIAALPLERAGRLRGSAWIVI